MLPGSTTPASFPQATRGTSHWALQSLQPPGKYIKQHYKHAVADAIRKQTATYLIDVVPDTVQQLLDITVILVEVQLLVIQDHLGHL